MLRYSKVETKSLGQVRISEINRVSFRQLSTFDAEIGGFEDLEALRKALIRAGFRFKRFEEYSGFKIGFTWVT